MNPPKISAFCCTYRRPTLLAEAVQSFLVQDYAGEKELIILNDEPAQRLVFRHPQVTVINLPTRAPSFAAKYNHALSLCTGEIRTPWDDDDIYLPHRLTSIAQHRQNAIWYADSLFTDFVPNKLTITRGRVPVNIAAGTNLFLRLGTHQTTAKLSFDFVIMHKLRHELAHAGIRITDPDMPSFIYRKQSTAHINHSDHLCADPVNHWEKYQQATADFTQGTIRINPNWSRDWQGLAEQAWAENKEPVSLHEIDSTYAAPAPALQPSCKTPAKPPQKKKAPAKKKAAKKAPAKKK